MKTINIHKETFLFALEQLPDKNVKELLDYTEFLLSREHIKKSKLKIDPKKDPIFGIIGLANEDPFASEIDDDLYSDR